MKLQDTLLCVECETLYAASSHCPQCGSHVSYPLVRALNRPAASGGQRSGPTTLFGGSGTIALSARAGLAPVLQRSA